MLLSVNRTTALCWYAALQITAGTSCLRAQPGKPRHAPHAVLHRPSPARRATALTLPGEGGHKERGTYVCPRLLPHAHAATSAAGAKAPITPGRVARTPRLGQGNEQGTERDPAYRGCRWQSGHLCSPVSCAPRGTGGGSRPFTPPRSTRLP